MHMCDPPRIYPSLSDYTLFFNNYMRPSQKLPLPPRIYSPPFNNYMRPSQNLPLPPWNIPPFSTTTILCDPPRIYPSLPEYTPLFNNYNIMRRSQNLPLLPRIYPTFQQMHMCDPPRLYPPFQQLYATLPGSTPSSQNIIFPFLTNLYVRPSQNLPLPPRIYPPFQEI